MITSEVFDSHYLNLYRVKLNEVNVARQAANQRFLEETLALNKKMRIDWENRPRFSVRTSSGYKLSDHIGLPPTCFYIAPYPVIAFTFDGYLEWCAGGDEVLDKLRPLEDKPNE